MISRKQFATIFPTLGASLREQYRAALVAAMVEFDITTRRRAAAFCAQVGHESGDLRLTHEGWQGRPDQGTAAQHRYDTRRDLGNTPERDGDGFKYRGHGWLQTTGKGNHRRVSRGLGLGDLFVDQPEMLERPEYAGRSAGYFWADNRINRVCDALNGTGDGADIAQFDKVSKIVNGGTNGRDDRRRRYKIALRALGSDAEFAEAAAEFKRSRVLDFRRPGTAAGSGDGQGENSSAQATGSAQSVSTASGSPEGQETPEKGIAGVAGDNKNVSQGTQETSNSSILDEIPINDTTKGIGRAAATRAGKTFARPFAIITTALAAGNVWAWATLIVIVAGLGWLAWVHRDDIRRFVLRMLRKVNS